MSMYKNSELPVPDALKAQFPLSAQLAQVKARRDAAIRDVFTGASDKFLVIVGPCSADSEDSVCEYISRLVPVQERLADKLIIIPRIYTNKPRTTGEGYKGMLHQPSPDKAPDLLHGIIAIRKLHIRAIAESGLTAADEMLYPENRSYLDDLLSYEAVGARSVENQQHRLTASSMDIPVGMKNPTSGDLAVMLNSVQAAQAGHRFLYRGCDVTTSGNPVRAVRQARLAQPHRDRRLQPFQFEQEVPRADPHRGRSDAQPQVQPRPEKDDQGPDDRELPRRGKPAHHGRPRLRQVHHRPLPGLGGYRKAIIYHRRAGMISSARS